jgi:hypothetical protein
MEQSAFAGLEPDLSCICAVIQRVHSRNLNPLLLYPTLNTHFKTCIGGAAVQQGQTEDGCFIHGDGQSALFEAGCDNFILQVLDQPLWRVSQICNGGRRGDLIDGFCLTINLNSLPASAVQRRSIRRLRPIKVLRLLIDRL